MGSYASAGPPGRRPPPCLALSKVKDKDVIGEDESTLQLMADPRPVYRDAGLGQTMARIKSTKDYCTISTS